MESVSRLGRAAGRAQPEEDLLDTGQSSYTLLGCTQGPSGVGSGGPPLSRRPRLGQQPGLTWAQAWTGREDGALPEVLSPRQPARHSTRRTESPSPGASDGTPPVLSTPSREPQGGVVTRVPRGPNGVPGGWTGGEAEEPGYSMGSRHPCGSLV